MGFSYDAALVTARDRLRFAVGDTVADEVLLDDETYDAVLAWHGDNEDTATRAIASALLARYAREPDRIEDDLGLQVIWQNRLKGWQQLASATAASSATASGFRTRSPSRGDRDGAEHYAGCRLPMDQSY